jgi:hypothetical protein
MSRRPLIAFAAAGALLAAVLAAVPASPVKAAAASITGCGLVSPAFCDTFDQPTLNNPASNQRAGQLDGVLWGTSMNTGAYPGDEIATSGDSAPRCRDGLLDYPNNVQICLGELVTTVNDGGAVTSLAMYPRQPFNFASGSGTIAFDVSNDSGGSHAAWPELWVSDQPVPDPFVHEGSWQSVPQNGFGIRFAGCTDSNGLASICPDGPGHLGVDSAVVVQNHVTDDSFNGGAIQVDGYGDVTEAGPGQLNHYQIDVSPTAIDVYGANAFHGQVWDPIADPLVHIATITGFGTLGFDQGLVWLEDVHYNGDKFNCPPTCQSNHSFRWDNLGFTGPVLPRDLGFDVANNHAADSFPFNGEPAFDNAWTVPQNGGVSLTIPDVSGASSATGALLVFNFYSQAVIPLDVSLNGVDLPEQPWPFPDNLTYSVRTVAIPVPKSDVIDGADNTVTFSAGNDSYQVANIDLILEGAGAVAAG